LHAPPERILADDLTDVLENEVVGLKVSIRSQSIAFLFCFDDRDIGVLFPLKALVLASRAAPTIIATLHLGGTIDTVRIFAAGMVRSSRCVYISV
jgi:hypothetical protein